MMEQNMERSYKPRKIHMKDKSKKIQKIEKKGERWETMRQLGAKNETTNKERMKINRQGGGKEINAKNKEKRKTLIHKISRRQADNRTNSERK
jgi:hypothetical protein